MNQLDHLLAESRRIRLFRCGHIGLLFREDEVSARTGQLQVQLEVEVIVATLNATISAAQRVTRTVPIVMVGATMPVELGFVQSLARPGGNVTGTAAPGPETVAKSFHVLKEVAPSVTSPAILINPTAPGLEGYLAETSRAASALGMTLRVFQVTRADKVMPALERIAAGWAGALLVRNDGVTESRLRDIMAFAIEHRIVSIGTQTLSASVGGAIYYGSTLQDIVDRSVSYVDRILRGAKPSDLPVEQPTKFDLIISLKTMRALGITIPQSVLLRADEVIQ
jgi:putative ABC transport system substrate-binding protein